MLKDNYLERDIQILAYQDKPECAQFIKTFSPITQTQLLHLIPEDKMTQNKDQNKLLVEEVIYNSSSDISENEISLINSLPAEHILEILETIMHQDSDTVIRSRAFESILKLKHLDKVKFLVDLYDNYEAEWGNVCCEYLAQFKNDERSQKKLCDIAINAEDADVRFNAIESLWKIGDPSCLPVLRYVAEHDNGLDYEGFPIKLFAKRVISDLLASS